MARYSLKAVQKLVAEDRYTYVPENTVVLVYERLIQEGAGDDPGLELQALTLMTTVIASLSPENLSKRAWPAAGGRPAMDEYGVRDEQGRAWYVKFFVKDSGKGDVHICSFHRPKHDMDTVGGRLER